MESTVIKNVISIKDKKKTDKLKFKPTVKCILSFLSGFLLMNPFVGGKLSPFAISAVAISERVYSVFSCLGVLIGSIVFANGTDTLKYIISAVMCSFINAFASRYVDEKAKKYYTVAGSFSSLFIIGSAIMFATGFDGEIFLSVTYESMLCCAGSFIFEKAVRLVYGGREVSRFTSAESTVLICAFSIIIMPFYKYGIGGFSPVGLIFSVLILSCGKLRSMTGGAVAGICIGAVAGLSGEIGFSGTGYAVAGLLCGELSRKSKIKSIVGYLAPIIISAFIGDKVKGYMIIAEGIVGCAVFLAIPDKAFNIISEKINIPVPIFSQSDDSRILSKKLTDASSAIVHISDCVNAVQKALVPIPDEQLEIIIRSEWMKVCEDCELNSSCLDEVKIPDDETVSKIAFALKNNLELEEINFSKGFSSSCYCFDKLKNNLKQRYLSFSASLGAEGKVDQFRGLMSDQFKSMADILSSIACEFNDDLNQNSRIAEICTEEAQEFGLNVLSSGSYLDKLGRTFVTLEVSRPRENFNVTRFTESLSTAIGTGLQLPELTSDDGVSVFSFSQRIQFEIELGFCNRSADDQSVCGDYFQSFYDGNGRHITVLSDGMGTGSRAAIDSVMAADVFSRLIKSGLSFDCALPIVNSALLVKSSDESLATLDVLCIDPYTGRTDFMKAGAAATFIRHKNSVAALEQASLPIGILRDIEFSKATAKLDSGDIILMVSDGVLGECNGWINRELNDWKDNMNNLAEHIVNSACERKLGKHRDDITVIAIQIKKKPY